MHLHGFALLLAEQGFADGRLHADAALQWVDFLFADDAVGLFALCLDVHHFDCCAELDGAVFGSDVFDNLCSVQDAVQFAQAAVNLADAHTAIGVGCIFAAVAFGGGGLHLVDHGGAFLVLEVFPFGREFFETLFGNKAKNDASDFISALAAPVEQSLAKNINEILQNHSQEIVSNLIGNEINNLMSRRMCDLMEGKDDKVEQLKSFIISSYRSIITNQLPKILDAVNISKIVESRINEMDVNETERLIFAVMDKELKAIVWLGAGLGFIMGFVNVLI